MFKPFLGFRVLGLGFGVELFDLENTSSLASEVKLKPLRGLGLRVWSVGFRIVGLEFGFLWFLAAS